MKIDSKMFDKSLPLSLPIALEEAVRAKAIPTKRLPRVRAALAAFARLMARPATELPAHRGFVIRHLRRLRRQPTGVSLKTLSNTRSELLFVIRAVGGHTSTPLMLSHGWDLYKAKFIGQPTWWWLTRLASYSSAQKVRPSDVNDGHIQRFEEVLRATGEIENAARFVRHVVTAWNKLAVADPALGISPLTLVPASRPRWTLPEQHFTKELRRDIDVWLARLTKSDYLSPSPLRALRSSTIRTRRHQIFKAASALVLSGRDIKTVRSLADLVTIENFQTLMRHLLNRQNGPTEALHGLATALLAVARHHVRIDEQAEIKLARLVKNLDLGVSGFRSKTRARLKPFEEDDRHLAALFNLPHQLLKKAKKASSSRRRQRLAQLAIAIEILTFAPLRIGNLASLRLGSTLRQLSVRNRNCWLISIPASEVKNRQELTHELPFNEHPVIATALKLYSQPEGWVFVGRRTGPKSSMVLSQQIKQVIESCLGIAFHTHMFRALAGYIHLRENPNGFESVRALLGNRNEHVVRERYAFLAERNHVAHAQNTIRANRAKFIAPLSKRRKQH